MTTISSKFKHGDSVVFTDVPSFEEEEHPTLMKEVPDWQIRDWKVRIDEYNADDMRPNAVHTIVTTDLDNDRINGYYVRIEDLDWNSPPSHEELSDVINSIQQSASRVNARHA